MTLTSATFIAFITLVILIYYILPQKIQWVWLLITSFAFYWYACDVLVFYLIATVITTYIGGRKVEQLADAFKEEKKALTEKAEIKILRKKYKKYQRAVITLVVVINIGMLIFTKFGSKVFNGQTEIPGTGVTLFHVLVPLGISFYTMSAISYLLDIYYSRIRAERNILKYGLFVSFFPQIIQGPMSRFGQLGKQLTDGHRFDLETVQSGLQLMLWGYFKKMVIADRAVLVVNQIFDNFECYEGVTLLFGVLMYTIQIYCDFSGGIDIISGVAKCMGIDMAKNFERPYFSKSIPEFWRRWHISLGLWFKDYIFYPLSMSGYMKKLGRWGSNTFKNRAGKLLPTCIIFLIVWFLNGAWHGAGMQFILFGMYHGVLTILGTIFEPQLQQVTEKLKINTKSFSWKLFQVGRTFALVCFGRIIYKSTDFDSMVQFIKAMFSNFNPGVILNGSLLKLGLSGLEMAILAVAVLILLVAELQQRSGSVREKINQQNLIFRWTIYIGVIVCILLFGMYGPTYNAGDFVYMRF